VTSRISRAGESRCLAYWKLSFEQTSYMPRDMPFTFGLGVELCIFEQPVIDAIVTLRSNLAITRESMEDVSNREGGAWRLQIVRLLNGLRFTMDIAAECFEHLAPARELKRDGKEPELFSKVLRNRQKSSQ